VVAIDKKDTPLHQAAIRGELLQRWGEWDGFQMPQTQKPLGDSFKSTGIAPAIISR
jgi:hypothetical protein